MEDPVPEFGGYSDIARLLTVRGPRTVSRQGVYEWYMRRDRNGFPEEAAYTGNGRKLFRISEILAWYGNYMPSRTAHWGERKKKKKE